MYFDYTHLHSFSSSYHIYPHPTPSQYHVLLFVFNNPLSPICTFGCVDSDGWSTYQGLYPKKTDSLPKKPPTVTSLSTREQGS